ncbi:acyl-CoA-binding domain-containing protein 3-like isoform X2 [Aristolochia californica]|uniref:acyl-CoA-binding domain-containing protein 3-like isoform X2 n=1 Tax=Aristolochia californica TaxID=171875 RepID=UPI0035D5A3BE
MEIFSELLLTALLSLVVAFFLAKLLSVASVSSDSEGKSVGVDAVEVATGGSDGRLETEGRRLVEDREIRTAAPSVVEVDEVAEIGRVELRDSVLGEEEEQLVWESVEERLEEVKDGGGLIARDVSGAEVEKDRVNESTVRSASNLEEQVVENVRAEGNEGEEVIENARVEKSGGGKKEKLFNDEDDWEGIEKSDLERQFGVVSGMVASDEGGVAEKVGSDVHMQLYALHKIATEGPCYGPQPSMLKSSVRAKWNAWQQLGNMNPDLAMEQYITLVLESIPDWKESICAKWEEQIVSPKKVSRMEGLGLCSSQHHHLDSGIERSPDNLHGAVTSDCAKFSEEGHAS